MKSLLVITDFSNTCEKQDNTRRLLNSLSDKHTILLISHINLPTDIVNRVDYYLYDKSNDSITNSRLLQPIMFGNDNFKLEYRHHEQRVVTYLPSIIKMFVNVLSFAKSLKYDYVHLLEYDTIIKDENIFNINQKILNEDNDVVLFVNDDCYKYGKLFWSTGNLISLSIKNFINENFTYDYKKIYQDFKLNYEKDLLPAAEHVIFDMFWKNKKIKEMRVELLDKYLITNTSQKLNIKKDINYCLYLKENSVFYFFRNLSKLQKKINFIINDDKIITTNINSSFWKTNLIGNKNEIKTIKMFVDNDLIFNYDLNDEYDLWKITSTKYIEYDRT